MPMLYGEGEKAFMRLQEEIAKDTNDLTLFAWQAVNTDQDDSGQSACQKYRGILARSPAEFANAGDIVPRSENRLNEEFIMTNKGLRITTDLAKGSPGDYVLSLKCSRRGRPEQNIGIYLRHHVASLYARDKPQELAVAAEWIAVWLEKPSKTIYISKNINQATSASVNQVRRHAIRCRHGFDNASFSGVTPSSLWDEQNKIFLTEGHSSFAGILSLFVDGYSSLFVIAFAMSDRSPPWAVFLNEHMQKHITPVWYDQSRVFQLPKSIMMSKKVFYDKKDQPALLSISLSLEEGIGNREPMYCIDIQVEETDPGSLPSKRDYRNQLMAT
jgi:hypothetical protein